MKRYKMYLLIIVFLLSVMFIGYQASTAGFSKIRFADIEEKKEKDLSDGIIKDSDILSKKEDQMTTHIPEISFGINEASKNVVILGDANQAGSISSLVLLEPGLLRPEAAGILAGAVNHIAKGSDYRVINDVAAYEAEYRETLAKEDPAAPFRAGVLRLRDHGIPDFTKIHPPRIIDDQLVFYVRDVFVGLPYIAMVDLSDISDEVHYGAVSLTPLTREPTIEPNRTHDVPLPPSNTSLLADPPLVIEDIGDDDEPDYE